MQANFRIKGWKQRWFVLDSTKHEIRYYDTREDFQCKGQINLADVTKITGGSSAAPGAPKGSEEGCYFELHTQKRNYCFCADSPEAAQEWIQTNLSPKISELDRIISQACAILNNDH